MNSADASILFDPTADTTLVIDDIAWPPRALANEPDGPEIATGVTFEARDDAGRLLTGELYALQTPAMVEAVMHESWRRKRPYAITGRMTLDRHPESGLCWIKGRISVA